MQDVPRYSTAEFRNGGVLSRRISSSVFSSRIPVAIKGILIRRVFLRGMVTVSKYLFPVLFVVSVL